MTEDEANQRLFDAARSANVTDTIAAIKAGADVNAKDEDQATPLDWAAQFGHTDLARLLIEKGADANAKGSFKQTPLHWAVDASHAEVARLLIENGADVNAKDEDQRMPLDWAAQFGHQKTADVLRSAMPSQGAHTDRVAQRRNTPGGPEVGG